MPRGARKTKWIQGAIKHPGAFTNYCRRTGAKSVTGKCIARGRHSPSSHVKHEANVAANLRKIAHRR